MLFYKHHVRNYMEVKKEIKGDIYLLILFYLMGSSAYQTLIVNELPNPDAIWNGLVYKQGWEWECSLGRFMIRFFQMMFGNIINPATTALLGILVVAIICVIISNVLGISNYIFKFLCGGLIMLTPAITGTLSYHYCSFYYLVAYLFAVLAAAIMCKKRGIFWGISAAVLLCLSLGTYQAYIGVTLVICLFFMIKTTIDDNKNGKMLVKLGINMVFSTGSGILLYLLANKFFLHVWKITAEEGRGFSRMGSVALENIPNLLRNCYIYVYQYFFSNEMVNNFSNNFGKRNVNIVWIVLLLVIILCKIFSMKKSYLYKVLALVELAVLPVAIMSITVAGSGVSIYDTTGLIMLPTTNYIYILPLVLLPVNVGSFSDNLKRWVNYSVIAVSCIMLLALYNYSSAMQMYQKASLQKMNYVAQNIAREIEEYIYEEGDYQVCIIGRMEKGNYPEIYPALADEVKWTTASYKMVWDDFRATQECWRLYIEQYFGVSYKTCEYEKYNEIIGTSEHQNRAIFPNEESVYLYDESIIVIKLSEQ